VLGKEVFGGTGMNFMNPALVARAFLFFAYPAGMSGDKVWTAIPPALRRTAFPAPRCWRRCAR
jgi:Na+-transporting NADH:ubiquinone oxidoreductase subunit B